MKRALKFCLISSTVLMLAGCGDKFEPTESTVYVTSKGKVRSAVMESFEESYYDFEELTEDVELAVESYCTDVKKDGVKLDSLTEKEDVVTLRMDYASVSDYADFNDVILFSGTFSEAVAAGYRPTALCDADGQPVTLTEEEKDKLKVIVTEENICIQTSETIKYVSDNVTIMDKKLAKAFEAGKTHLAFVLYK